MGQHYVIGDVHGEYEMLLALVNKLPKDAKLIFVGDLVNRGLRSSEVIAFVRKNAFAVIQGNHETYLLENAKFFWSALTNTEKTTQKTFGLGLWGQKFYALMDS